MAERGIEQDYRAAKRRCASMTGFKSFDNAAITIAGIELTHRIRKNQFSSGRGRRGWSRKAECASVHTFVPGPANGLP